MDEISVIGIDLAKRVFELCAQTPTGKVAWTKRLRRKAFMQFMREKAPHCVVAFEACGGAHHWGRWLTGLGFTVKLMAPRVVKAYRQGPHKSDGRDARACAEAGSRETVRALQIKSAAAQAVQALVRVRTLQIKQMVQIGNQIRGLLNEFGIVMPKGHKRLRETVASLADHPDYAALPAALRTAIEGLCVQLADQVTRVKAATKAVAAATRDEATCANLHTVPGLGPINVATLSVALDLPEAFPNARAFAASLRLIPRLWQSGDKKEVLRGVGRETANETRRHLVLAGHSLITMVNRMKEPPEDGFLLSVYRLGQRKHRNVAAVAVAAKLARIAWALASRGEAYRPRLLKGTTPVTTGAAA